MFTVLYIIGLIFAIIILCLVSVSGTNIRPRWNIIFAGLWWVVVLFCLIYWVICIYWALRYDQTPNVGDQLRKWGVIE